MDIQLKKFYINNRGWMHRNKTAKRAHNTSLTKSSHCQGLVASLEVPASSQEPKKYKKLLAQPRSSTSSAMISDCSSLLNRLDRSPPASTLFMYSRKPWKKLIHVSFPLMSDTHLFFDILVSEEECGSST